MTPPKLKEMNVAKLGFILACILMVQSTFAADVKVTGIQAVYRNGQTFVTWKDAAEGEEGAKLRYSLYRSATPITQANLSQAECCYNGVLNNSAKLFGSAFYPKDRVDPQKPYVIIEEGGHALPPWSGLAVHTVVKDGEAYYAVVATDEKYAPLSAVVPGESATTAAVSEKVAPIQPIKLYDSKSRGVYSPQTCLSGKQGLPLAVTLHASQGQGGGAGEYGDYYLYFATAEMGWRDGLPGVFSVKENHDPKDNVLVLENRDCIENPNGKQAMETYWFGYYCVPQGATHKEARAYPFTEKRLEFIVDWVIKKYAVDPMRVNCSGGSMGAWGSTSFGFRRPQFFAAVYPNRPRTIQRGLPALVQAPGKDQKVLMADGQTDYYERMNSVKFATETFTDLPFYGWCCGRNDGFATWKEQIEMVKAMTRSHHGFAFAWNNGDHSTGTEPMGQVQKYYPAALFAKNVSYPAFGNSSIDNNLGNGDPKDGDLIGGINLGFHWSEIADEESKWSVKISNELAKDAMTVDVTPRRCQKFKAAAGETLKWSSSGGANGTVKADEHGLVTVEKVALKAGEPVTLTISR